ncbi:MAG TPA: Holliday junction resolvase RuvX [Pyrinomonadaceae bacterium]
MSDEKTNANLANGSISIEAAGRLLALDLGEKRTGVAITDEMRLTVRPLPVLHQTSWKELLRSVAEIVRRFDAKALVIGLPLNFDGTEGAAAEKARKRAHDFELSLKLPVYLQDERLTSRAAEEHLRSAGHTEREIRELVDSRSAAIILNDFLEQHSKG